MSRNSDDYEKEAREWLMRGDPDTALRVFRDGLSQFPGNIELLLGCGMAHIALGNFVQAVEILEPLRSKHPKWGDVLQGLAEAYFKMGRKKNALGAIEHATGEHETDPVFINSLAIMLFEQGFFKEAAACHMRAFKRDYRYAPAYMGIGVCKHKMGDIPGAVHALRGPGANQN